MTTLPVLSRLVDRVTGAAGLLVLVVAVSLPDAVPPWQAWLAVPVVVLAGRKPLVLPTASSQALVIGLDSALLVLLGLTLPLRQALVVWGVALVVGEGSIRRSVDTRLFNGGVSIVSGAAALSVLGLVPPGARTSGVGLAAVVVAAAVYFTLDGLWSAVSVAVAEGLPLRRTLQVTGLPLALACFLGVHSLGFLAAVVLEARPWALGLLGVPFVSLLLSTSSWSALRRVQQRSALLSSAVVALQQASSPQEVERLVLEHAPTLVSAPAAWWAGEGGAGLPFVADGIRRDLLLQPRVSGVELSARDREALRMLLGVAEQAHERLRLLEVLRRSALEDPLTGLANRTVLHEQLAAAVRAPSGLAVLYCDLDGFKRLNDSRGHAVGDALLVAVADRLRTTLRPQDLAVRLGGDEFAVLLRELPAEGVEVEAALVAERLRAALALPYSLSGAEVVVPASVGLCVRTGGEEPADLLCGSDAAMYAAKAAGGRAVRVHRTPVGADPGGLGAPR